MAFRIHESVVRGEIDNREKGTVRGRLWIHGRSEPVLLQLQGNAQADLAGCLLTFVNPLDPAVDPGIDRLAPVQRGTIGDLTASRKVRVFNIPFDEAYALMQRGGKPPEQIANSLYLEWFSEANGRVVVESADFKLTISDPEWRLTPEEEQQRAQEAAKGFTGFLDKLSEAVEAARHKGPEDLEEWDEFDFEKSMRESDAITDKYVELLEKYGDSPEAEQRIAREMGWDSLAEALQEAIESPAEIESVVESDTAEEDDEDDDEEADDTDPEGLELSDDGPDDLPELEPDPATKGVDWIPVDKDIVRHPLAHRAHLVTVRIMGLVNDAEPTAGDEGALLTLMSGITALGTKLAGALNGLAYGRPMAGLAFTVAYLKRALEPLHKAQAALRIVSERQHLEPEACGWLRNELFEIREEILRLMDDFRRRHKDEGD